MAQNTDANPILFGVGVLSMMLSLCLFVFTCYIIPYTVFNANYDVPEFIVIVSYWYSSVQGLSGFRLGATIILPYLLSATILAFIAQRLTKKVENQEKADIVSLQNLSLSELIKPALYEIILIAAVLVTLFFAIFVILVKFD